MNTTAQGLVASGHELVSQAVITVLEAGGNAFDGVVAAGFAGAVTEQTLTSLGGGGFLLARTSTRRGPAEAIFFDFFVNTPGLGRRTSGEPHFFPVVVDFGNSQQTFNIGLGSVAVPGTLKGLLHVHARLGRLPLQEVVAPAIALARGHRLNTFQAGFLGLLKPIVSMTDTGRTLYLPHGTLLQPGDQLVNTAMAEFLEQLVEDRGASFYQGDIARQIDQDMRAGQGLLTGDDLAAYQVIERQPLHIPYHGRTLLTAPPPSLGGTLIGLSLSLLDRLQWPTPWGSGDHLLFLAGLMQEVEKRRQEGITSPEKLAAFLQGQGAWQSVEHIRVCSRGTTHVSVADSEGNVASMTCSNGEGSGYFAPGTGIMLNNMMGEDDLHPDGFHTGVPGERVGSMMAPSILVGDAGVELVLGSGGSKRIRTAMVQVLTQIVDFQRDPATAVHAPRIHWDGNMIQMEPGFAPEAVRHLARRMAVNVWDNQSMYFGGVHLVVPGREGVGDPRRGGVAASTDQ